MYKRMLVPLDGSELAEVVFPYAKELAGRLGLAVTMLYVCSPGERDEIPMYRAYVERAAEIVRHQSEEVRKGTGIRRKPIEARAEVVVGHTSEEILHFANDNNIDLILMATHGRSGIRRWALGSVTDKVVRASKVPVLLVRAGIPEQIVYGNWPRLTILVPLDGSKLAESVLPHVEALAKQRGAQLVEVVLLRVCEPPVILSDYPEAVMPLSWEEHLEKEMAGAKRGCRQYLAEVGKRLRDIGISVRSEVLIGKAADEIIDYASKNPHNLIVIATHGRSGITRWAYGSVAEKVLLGVSSPLLLVRPVKLNGSQPL